jgi:hypothetical protein
MSPIPPLLLVDRGGFLDSLAGAGGAPPLGTYAGDSIAAAATSRRNLAKVLS